MRVKDAVIVARRLASVDIDNVFDPADIVEWIRRNYYPEEVFTKEDLTRWAEDNSFVLEEE